MPTNNQEKWWKKRFTVQPDKIEDLALDSSELLQAEDDGDYLVTVRKDEADAFLLQEIRQAKIDRDKEIATLLENTVMQHVEDSNNSLHVRYLKKIISNLKQNDQPTKN